MSKGMESIMVSLNGVEMDFAHLHELLTHGISNKPDSRSVIVRHNH